MIIMLKGNISSGKSTWAKKYSEEHPNTIILNKDTIRKEHFPDYKNRRDEKRVIEIETQMCLDALKKSKDEIDIIIDDTNLNQVHERRFRNIAIEFDIEFKIEDSFLSVPIEECIKRDKERENSVGEQIIREMYYKYLAPKYEYIEGLPTCVIFDIDGTLAKKGDRDIYDGSKVYLDTVIQPVAYINTMCRAIEKKIFIMSGRQEIHREVTEKWLEDNDIFYNGLFMRKTDDMRDDSIIKWELFCENILGKYNVLFVCDDRLRVIRMWWEKGLFVLDVNQGNIEF